MQSSGGELFIVDNNISGWTALKYLEQWTDISTHFDIATGFFEVGALLALNGQWQKLEKIRILMGDETFRGTKRLLLKAIKERNIKPTVFLPIWDLLGVTLGFGTTMLGEKAAMLCTASVEEVIDGHYKSQLDKLGDDEKSLKKSITKFRQDEIDHKNLAYNEGATKKGLYFVLDKIIQTTSKAAIKVSEKI